MCVMARRTGVAGGHTSGLEPGLGRPRDSGFSGSSRTTKGTKCWNLDPTEFGLTCQLCSGSGSSRDAERLTVTDRGAAMQSRSLCEASAERLREIARFTPAQGAVARHAASGAEIPLHHRGAGWSRYGVGLTRLMRSNLHRTGSRRRPARSARSILDRQHQPLPAEAPQSCPDSWVAPSWAIERRWTGWQGGATIELPCRSSEL